jgi:hypothetical protein
MIGNQAWWNFKYLQLCYDRGCISHPYSVSLKSRLGTPTRKSPGHWGSRVLFDLYYNMQLIPGLNTSPDTQTNCGTLDSDYFNNHESSFGTYAPKYYEEIIHRLGGHANWVK